jgi:hypothetical protein
MVNEKQMMKLATTGKHTDGEVKIIQDDNGSATLRP